MRELSLHPYQAEDRDFLVDNPRAGLIHTMGLGKTAIVLSAVHELMFNRFELGKVLIIAPKNVALIAWPGEHVKWKQFRDFTFTILHGPEKDKNITLRRDVYIINYDGLEWFEKQYRKKHHNLPKFGLVVFDESTFAKNVSSQRHKRSARIAREIGRAVVLTGTPSPNGYLDLYGQMELLKESMLARTFTSYKNNYFIPPANGAGKWHPRAGVRDIISAKMVPFIRTRGEEVLNRNEPTYNTIPCILPAENRREYEELENELFLKLQDGNEIEVFNSAALSMKLRQYVSGFLYQEEKVFGVHSVKIDALLELVESLNGSPLLCGLQFTQEIAMIQKAFGYEVPFINGKVKGKARNDLIARWNAGDLPLLLVNSSSVSHGLNMQEGGHTFLWFSLPWASDIKDQAEARIDRQGQREAVIIHSLIVQDTMDVIMQDRLQAKGESQRSLIQKLKELRDARKQRH